MYACPSSPPTPHPAAPPTVTERGTARAALRVLRARDDVPIQSALALLQGRCDDLRWQYLHYLLYSRQLQDPELHTELALELTECCLRHPAVAGPSSSLGDVAAVHATTSVAAAPRPRPTPPLLSSVLHAIGGRGAPGSPPGPGGGGRGRSGWGSAGALAGRVAVCGWAGCSSPSPPPTPDNYQPPPTAANHQALVARDRAEPWRSPRGGGRLLQPQLQPQQQQLLGHKNSQALIEAIDAELQDGDGAGGGEVLLEQRVLGSGSTYGSGFNMETGSGITAGGNRQNTTPGGVGVALAAVADDERQLVRLRCVLLLHLQCSGLYDARVVQQLVEGSELHLERVRVWGCVWVRFSEDRAHGRDSVCVCVGQGGHPEPAPCTPHTSPYIILPEPYSPHNSPYIIPPEPYTPHNSPYIIPPEPHTPHTSPYIVPPEPYTTHTSPYIIPPELYTPHTSPYIIPTEPYLMPTPCRSSCTTVWVSTRLLCVCSPWSWLMWRRL